MPFIQLPHPQHAPIRLAYFQHGHGPERVLLIHGFQASGRIWRRLQDLLPADRYTTIAINNRGAGASDAPAADAEYSVEHFAADARAAMQALGWSRFTLVGHSLGGVTVAAYVAQWPGDVQGLVLLDPADPDGRAGTDEEIERIVDGAMRARRAQQARGGGGDGIDARAIADDPTMQALTDDINAAPEQRLRGSMRSMFKARYGAAMKSLQMPVLLIGGDADKLIPVASMLGTWAKFPAGTGLHFWHGIGHSPNLDCPEELATVLRRFIEETIPARSAV